MGLREVLAAPAGANPLLPNTWEIFGTVVGFLVFALLIFALFMILIRPRLGTSSGASSNKTELHDEIARRTESIEKRLGNIEKTFEKVTDE